MNKNALDNFIHPKSIVVVGASADTKKPGGKMLANIVNGHFDGKIYAVTKSKLNYESGRLFTFKQAEDLPPRGLDLAILAVPSFFILDYLKILLIEKHIKSYIIISAGFSEVNNEGLELEKEVCRLLEEHEALCIGPNCIGVLSPYHSSIFAGPIPKTKIKGIDVISQSGANLVYMLEQAHIHGTPISSIFSLGNAPLIKIEDMLEYLDLNYDPEKSSKVSLIYMEGLSNPAKFVQHALSLYHKGHHIAILKGGNSQSGKRASLAHTGSQPIETALFDIIIRKSKVIACQSRNELLLTGQALLQKELKGNKIGIITHAGGPGVILSDQLEILGFEIPAFDEPDADELKTQLYPGSATRNPIDILATGTPLQLEKSIDFCLQDKRNLNALIVVYGTPDLFDMSPTYELIAKKIKESPIPIFPVFLSPLLTAKALEHFKNQEAFYFSEENLAAKILKNIHDHYSQRSSFHQYHFNTKQEAKSHV